MEDVTLGYNYQTCSSCKKFADDGGLKDGKFMCMDCLKE